MSPADARQKLGLSITEMAQLNGLVNRHFPMYGFHS